MSKLKSLINSKLNNQEISQEVYNQPPTPLIFGPNISNNFEESLIKLMEKEEIKSIKDTYKQQLVELFYLRHSSLNEDNKEDKAKLAKFLTRFGNNGDFTYSGVWVYYPWTKQLIHFLDLDLYQEIRTARNKLLITKQEQETFRKFVVGIAGLSIGNSVALSLAYSGGCETTKLADPDVFSASNLNRVRVPAYYIGVKKVYVAAQQIYELNPYAKLQLYPSGITLDNLEQFILGKPKLQLVVDEMDNLQMKIFIRLASRAARLPLVMATDNGDNTIIDIDRFDINPNIAPFNQLPTMELGDLIKKIKQLELPNLTINQRIGLATSIVGANHVAIGMQKSLMEVGNSIASWPQLGIAAFTGGAALAYIIKKIALREKVKQGKSHISFDELFIEDFHSDSVVKERKEHTEKFKLFISDIKISILDVLKF